jgi:chromosomal replication initiation ATPase DnaA
MDIKKAIHTTLEEYGIEPSLSNEIVKAILKKIQQVDRDEDQMKSDIHRVFESCVLRWPTYYIKRKQVNAKGELRNVREELPITMDSVKSKSRILEITKVRHVIQFVLCEYRNYSMTSIGMFLGGRDHSTVIHAKQTVRDLKYTDKSYRAIVEQIESEFIQHERQEAAVN